MRKIAWPYIGTQENEMASMKGHGNYRDFIEEGYTKLDSLTPEKFTTEDNQAPTATLSSGKRYTLSDDPMESNMFFDFLFDDIEDNSNVLVISDDTASLEACANERYNIFSLSKTSNFNSDKIICENGDSKYFKFNKKFDSFYLESNNLEDIKLSFLNLNDQLKNISYGYIKTNIKENDLKKSVEYANINFSSIKKINNSIFQIKINNLRNSNIVGVLDKFGSAKAAFICDIADSFEKKTVGLQAYGNIRNSFGLMFPYKRATDVSYHMGTVNYPIDIIFLDESLSIKKIERNIQPGTPGIFSCANVSAVLEVKGGMSSLLDISVGDQAFIDSAESLSSDSVIKNTAIKISSILPSNIYKHGDVNIKVNGTSEFSKTASIQNIDYIENKVAIIDLDLLFNYNVKVYKIASYDPNNIRIAINSSPKTISNNFIEIDIAKFASEEIGEQYCLPATISSFNESINFATKEALENILKFDGKIVLATKNDYNWSKIASILNFKTHTLFGKSFPTFEVLRMAQNDSILNASQERYKDFDLFFLNKKAGFPVPQDVVDKAKKAEKLFKESKKKSEELLRNLKKNLSVYQGIQADKEKVKNSKYEYNESVERNTEKLKKLLLDIKEGLKIMNEIKDISTTFEIISAVADSAMRSSKNVKEIFDLVEIIENDDFITQLTQKTGEAEKMFLDLANSKQRMINYINSDILGVLVITP